MKARAAIASLVLAVLALTGCGGDSGPITVGSKDFTEQRILAEMVAQLAADRGARVDRVVPYPGDVSPVSGVQDGTIDVYVEYVGTALLGRGLPAPADGDAAFDLVQRESEELGLTWLPRLGFANDYAIVVTPDFAVRFGLTTISDLRRVEQPVAFGADPEYLRRPVDGLDSLVSRYGLVSDPEVFTTTDKRELYGALSDGAVDVVQGFTTDPQIDGLDLIVLEDDLDFFPSYDAAPLTRQSLIEVQPELEQALRDLAGMLDDSTMRRLIAEVDLEQREVDLVARQQLIALGLLPNDAVLPARGDALVVAIGLDDARSGSTGRALDAIREAYPGRPLEVAEVQDPADAVLRGEARLAVADAETVFEPTDRSSGADRAAKPLEGIAAVELRSVHLLASSTNGDIESIGVGQPGSPSHETALTLIDNGVLSGASISVVPGASIGDRVAAVTSGRLDAALAVSPVGQPQIQQAIVEDGLVLRSVEAPAQLVSEAPHLRAGIIPGASYVGQADDVATVTQQAAVLGPSSDPLEPALHGPHAYAGGSAQPIAAAAVRSIQEVLDQPRVDPVLPRTPLPLTTADDLIQPTNPTPWVSVANVAVLAALVALGFAIVRRTRAMANDTGDQD